MRLLRGVGWARAKFLVGSTYQYLTFATMKEINLGITAEDTRQTGGDRLFPLDILTHTKSGRIRIVDAQLVMDVFQLMGSGTASASGNVMVPETLTVTGGAVTTNATYIVGTVSLISATGDAITTFTATDGTNITSIPAEHNGTKIKVLYETDECTAITKFSLHVDDEPVYFELLHTSRYRDPSDNNIRIFQTRIYRCRMVGNIEYTFTHGEFAAPTIEAEVLDPDRSDGVVLDYTFATEPAGLTHS